MGAGDGHLPARPPHVGRHRDLRRPGGQHVLPAVEGGRRASGGKELHERDVALLGDDTIHAVTNPRRTYTGAIHIYGGDFFTQPRSEFDPETLEERPYDVERALAMFEAANAEAS